MATWGVSGGRIFVFLDQPQVLICWAQGFNVGSFRACHAPHIVRFDGLPVSPQRGQHFSKQSHCIGRTDNNQHASEGNRNCQSATKDNQHRAAMLFGVPLETLLYSEEEIANLRCRVERLRRRFGLPSPPGKRKAEAA
jgi:hypothetical protein